jgi:hypothetical protein
VVVVTMSATGTTSADPALGGEAITRDRGRAPLGQVMGFFLDVFNVFLLLLNLFGGERD